MQDFNGTARMCAFCWGGKAYSQNHPLEYTLLWRAFCVYVCRISMVQYDV